MAIPSVIATMPAAVVPSPLICPRSPLGTVRPCTSLDAIDVRHRPNENTVSAAMIAIPAASPEPTAAVSAMAATATAWTREPTTSTHLRCLNRTTMGVRNA